MLRKMNSFNSLKIPACNIWKNNNGFIKSWFFSNYSNTNVGCKSYEETIYEEPFNVVPRYLSTDDLTDEYAEPGVHMSNSLCENIYSQAVNIPRKGQLPPLPLSHYARPQSPPRDQRPPAPPPLPVPPPPPTYEPVLVSSGGGSTHRHSKVEKKSSYRHNGSNSTSSSSSNTPNGRYPPATQQPRRRGSSRSSRTSTLKKNESIGKHLTLSRTFGKAMQSIRSALQFAGVESE